jgi:hypothetical protein
MHDTNILIGRQPVNLEKVNDYGLAVAFEDEFAIIFLDQQHLSYWYDKLKLWYYSENKELEFGGDLVHFFALEIGLNNYVIAKLDAYDYGVLYHNSNAIDEGYINPILKRLGVKATNKENEFHQLNLDDYRYTECYYVESYRQRMTFNENIILGKID